MWSYIKLLVETQERSGVYLANKLKPKHIEYHNNKMKCSFALQVC